LKYLLDTCTVSEFIKPESSESLLEFLSEKKESDLFISTMTIAELHRGIMKLPNGKKKTKLLRWLEELEESFSGRIVSFDYEAAIVWARITNFAEQKGKRISAFDSIIAAIAERNHLALITRNIKDFKETGVELVNPW